MPPHGTPTRAVEREPILMILLAEAISEWITKGEVIDRYYNPGDLFGSLHIVLCNDDSPPPEALARMAGRASVHVHNIPLPERSVVKTLGWRPLLLRPWASRVVRIAQEAGPALVRCHGAGVNAFAAAEIRRRLGTPYAVSLHINPEEDVHRRAVTPRDRLRARLLRRGAGIHGLKQADIVLPVYESIVPFLRAAGIERYEVAYNVLNPSGLREKDGYALHDPVDIVSVGRQFEAKNPENLIRAVGAMGGARLTLIGDGPIHGRLRALADEVAPGAVHFERALDNAEVCARLARADLFAAHSDFWEMSKAVLEAMLTGLPVVVNRRPGQPVPELREDICVLVADDPAEWRAALERLIADDAEREALGRRAREHAVANWHPQVTERRFVEIYRRLLAASSR